MEPKGSIFEGKTLDDAVRKGLEALGLSRAEVMITVMDEGSSGFLGIGARPYRVRVMPRPGGAIREPGDRDRGDRGGRGRRGGRGEGRNGEARTPERGGDRGRAGAPRGAPRGGGRERAPEGERGRGRGDRERAPERGGERRVEAGGDRRPERGGERGGERERRQERPPIEAQERAPRLPVSSEAREPSEPREADREGGGDAGRRRRRGRRGRGGRPQEGRPQEEGTRAPVAEAMPVVPIEPDDAFEPEMAVESAERGGERERSVRPERAPMRSETRIRTVDEAPAMASDELVSLAQKTTTDLLKAMGFEGTITAKADGTSVEVTAEVADDEELLTGRKGETRQALQHLLTRMINRGEGSRYHLQLEINDFWQRREKELEGVARELANEAVESDSEVLTEYLNAQERRIIHVTLKEDPRVKTYAIGDGLIKKVAIAPADYPEGPPSES